MFSLLSTKNGSPPNKSIFETKGLRGFYRGFVPTLAKDSLFGASFLGHYYTLRDYLGCDVWYKSFISGAIAHCVTWLFFIPIDTIKTQYQTINNNRTIPQIISETYKKDGITRFWRGVVPACLRTIPVSGVAMIGYEHVRNFMKDRR